MAASLPTPSARTGALLRVDFGPALVKRWVAVLLLVVVATFLAASGRDHCDEAPGGHNQRAQHLLCVDDCAPALISQAPAPPPPDPMPTAVFEVTVARPVLNLDLEPEKEPPRA